MARTRLFFNPFRHLLFLNIFSKLASVTVSGRKGTPIAFVRDVMTSVIKGMMLIRARINSAAHRSGILNFPRLHRTDMSSFSAITECSPPVVLPEAHIRPKAMRDRKIARMAAEPKLSWEKEVTAL